MKRALFVVVMVSLCLTFLLWQRSSSSVQGQLKVGVLNSASIAREVQGLAELRRAYDEQRRAYLELINLRQNFLMLTGLEWVDLRRLLGRPQRTKSEEQQIQRLRQISLEREAELQRLQQTPPDKLTSQERTRLEQLTQIWKEARMEIEQLKNLMDEEMRRVEEQLNKLVDEKLQQVISKVADEKGLDIVLDKSVVYFVRGNFVDVTEEVLSNLTEALQSGEKTTSDGKQREKEEKQ